MLYLGWDLNTQVWYTYELKYEPINGNSRKNNWVHLKEKYLLMFRAEMAILNESNEIVSTCRHRLKPSLCNTSYGPPDLIICMRYF